MASRLIIFIIFIIAITLISHASGTLSASAQETVGTPAPTETAAEAPKLGIQPVGVDGTFFDFELEAGETKELTVQLGNFGAQEQAARTYVANVSTRVNGGMEIGTEEDPATGATTWLDYEAETLDIKPGKAIQKSFTVEVPDDTKPGQYLTGIVIQTAEPVGIGEESESNLKVSQILRQAIAVAITVPGEEEPALAIGEATYVYLPSAVRVRVAVENTGNVHLRPDAELVVMTSDRQEIARSDFQLDTLYASMPAFIEVGLLQPLQPGEYLVALMLKDEKHEIAVEETDLPLSVTNVDANGTPIAAAPVITIESLTVNELRDPSTNTLQGVDLVVAIDNPAPPISNARLTLHVTRDGQPVEDFVLGSSLSFPGGEAEFRQRYLPISGWTPGVWAFSVTLDVVDPATGEAVELTTVQAETTVTVS